MYCEAKRKHTRVNRSIVPRNIPIARRPIKNVQDKWNIINDCMKIAVLRDHRDGRHSLSSARINPIALKYDLSAKQIRRIYANYDIQENNIQINNGVGHVDLQPKKSPGRPLNIHQTIHNENLGHNEDMADAIRRITSNAGQCITYDELASALVDEGFSASAMTCWRIATFVLMCQMKYVHIRPVLTPANKLRRLK